MAGLIAALRTRGCHISELSLSNEPLARAADLLAAQAGKKDEARKDGSLQLLRPYGPLAAAEEAAAWLASLPSLDKTVVIGPEVVLDEALRRHGLPTLGATDSRDRDASLQILPLVLALGWDPPDPEQAKELLNLPLSPLPWALRSRLLRALSDWPGVGSETWRARLEEGLKALPSERRWRVRRRFARLFNTVAKRGQEYPCSEIRAKTNELLRVGAEISFQYLG